MKRPTQQDTRWKAHASAMTYLLQMQRLVARAQHGAGAYPRDACGLHDDGAAMCLNALLPLQTQPLGTGARESAR